MQLSDYLSLIPSNHADKPNYKAFLTAVLTQVLDLAPLVQSMTTAFNPATAVGPWLDALAVQTGITREPGETDTSLRSRLFATILSNHWPGTNESLIALLADLFPDASFNDLQNMKVSVSDPFVPVPSGILKC